MGKKSFAIGAGILAGVIAMRAIRRPGFDVRGKSVLITGGSRGLGLLLAHEFAARGARVAIIARDGEELHRAAAQFDRGQPNILTIEADVTVREQAEAAVRKAQSEFGHIDVLVNNAGRISVGPLANTRIDDFRDSLNAHFWAPYFTIMAALPDMQKRRNGRIVNISSIGGKIAVPHLLPYSVGKFALTGFSEGLRSELLKDNVVVTTVCPGLMRTGSPRNAFFLGNTEAEYAWFSISDSLPGLSMNAESAASQIVDACIRGDAEVVLSLPAKAAVKVHGVLPGVVIDLLGIANRFLPKPITKDQGARTGAESFSSLSPSPITVLNERAAKQNNEVG